MITFTMIKKELDFSMFENSNSNVPILYTSNNLSSVLSGICHPSGLSDKFILRLEYFSS